MRSWKANEFFRSKFNQIFDLRTPNGWVRKYDFAYNICLTCFYWMIDVNVRGVCSTLCTYTFHSLSSVAGQKATNGRMWIQVINPLSAVAAVAVVVQLISILQLLQLHTHTSIVRFFLYLSFAPRIILLLFAFVSIVCVHFSFFIEFRCVCMPIDSHLVASGRQRIE